MDVSAVIKTNMNDGQGVVFHAFSENLQPPMLASINDYTVAGLLSNFFSAESQGTDLESRYPFVRRIPLSNDYDPDKNVSIMMGLAISSFTDPSHSDSVSLACFSEAALRGRLVKAYEDIGDRIGNPEPVAPLINAAKTMPMSELGAFLSNAMTNMGGGREQITINLYKHPKLTITRLSQSDFATVKEWYSYAETPFIDGFDLIKDRVIRQEGYLNAQGYSSAVYTDNGGDGSNDTIVFTAEYGMSEMVVSGA